MFSKTAIIIPVYMKLLLPPGHLLPKITLISYTTVLKKIRIRLNWAILTFTIRFYNLIWFTLIRTTSKATVLGSGEWQTVITGSISHHFLSFTTVITATRWTNILFKLTHNISRFITKSCHHKFSLYSNTNFCWTFPHLHFGKVAH